jgi:hypothetical protein
VRGRAARLLVLAAGSVAACADPVHEDAVERLGPEIAGVAPGPLHRPGQPCGLCHGPRGPAEDTFALAGTVFERREGTEPAVGVTVRLIDGSGRQYSVRTNRAGNFYFSPSSFEPEWPVWIRLERDGREVEMASAIHRERSCGACHADPAGPAAVGHVYLTEEAP